MFNLTYNPLSHHRNKNHMITRNRINHSFLLLNNNSKVPKTILVKTPNQHNHLIKIQHTTHKLIDIILKIIAELKKDIE